MKFVWEEKDIIPGLQYGRPGMKETWIIGYHPNPAEEHRKWASTSLSDGMITVPYSTQEMAALLTRNEYVPLKLMVESLK